MTDAVQRAILYSAGGIVIAGLAVQQTGSWAMALLGVPLVIWGLSWGITARDR